MDDELRTQIYNKNKYKDSREKWHRYRDLKYL